MHELDRDKLHSIATEKPPLTDEERAANRRLVNWVAGIAFAVMSAQSIYAFAELGPLQSILGNCELAREQVRARRANRDEALRQMSPDQRRYEQAYIDASTNGMAPVETGCFLAH